MSESNQPWVRSMTLKQLKEEAQVEGLPPGSDAYVEFVKGIIILAIEFELLSPEDKEGLLPWWKETVQEWVGTHSQEDNKVELFPWPAEFNR